MKTQIIQLDHYDDIVSVRDKMAWAKTQRILLVFPGKREGRILTRYLDLLLILRHSQSLGAQVAIITRDHLVLENAHSLGIPTFSTTKKARNQTWKHPREKKVDIFQDRPQRTSVFDQPFHDLEKPWFERFLISRIVIFLIGIMAVIILVGILLPKADVVIHPMNKEQSLTLPLTASPEIDGIHLTGEVPVHVFTTIVEARDTVSSTGTVNIAENPAKGEVSFTNITSDKVIIPEGTVVTTLGDQIIRFKTLDDVTLKNDTNDPVDVEVQAILPGISGNVDEEEIQAVEGTLGLSVMVTNHEPIEGGSEQTSPAPTDEDLSLVRANLMKKLKLAALADLATKLEDGDKMTSETLSLIQIVSETQDTPIGQPADHLTLSIQAEYSIWVIDKSDIDELGRDILSANIESGYTPVANSFQSSFTSNVSLDDDNQLTWETEYLQSVTPEINTEELAQLISAKPVSQAKQLLLKLSEQIGAAKISMTPSWWPWTPFLPFRIDVQVSTKGTS